MLTQAPTEGDPPLAISMRISREGGVAVTSVAGEIDLCTAPQLQQYIDAVVDLGQMDIVIDAAELRFMDSTGLSVIIGGLQALHGSGGTLSVRDPQPMVRRLLDVSGIAKVLD